MKKFSKLLAMILAVLMLVTLSTACKKQEEEFVFEDGEGVVKDIGDEKDNEKGDDEKDDKVETNEKQDDEKKDEEKDEEKKDEEKKDEEKEEKPSDDIEQIKEEYIEEYKYDPQRNPLIAESKKPNTGVKPSFDIDQTGFVKNNIQTKDLKGKTLTLITAVTYDTFQYKNEKGEQIGEWEWWDALKKEYGLQIKYIKSRFDKSVSQCLSYMNSGKALDIVPTHYAGFPKFLNLSQPLDPYVNVQNLGNSPGVDLNTLESSRYGGGYRCISAVGVIDTLWYCQSLVEELGLIDPHTLYEQDKWDWDAFANFIKSVPATTPDGKKLYSFARAIGSNAFMIAISNGVIPIEIDTKSDKANLINNWTDQRAIDAYSYLSSVLQPAQTGGSFYKMYTDGDTLMSNTVTLMPTYDTGAKTLYCHGKKYNWVPWPKANTDTGRYACFNYGYTMMLARKLKNQSNAIYAVKFMELWATRFTEAMFDFLSTTSYLNFDYEDRKEYFEFATQDCYFMLQMNSWNMVDEDENEALYQFWKSVYTQGLNPVTECQKTANLAQKAIDACINYGI